jgi:hypothetical protein
MFTMFFSHLTTSIAEIDVYLTKNKTGRERVETINRFNDLVTKAKGNVADQKKPGAKGKKVEEKGKKPPAQEKKNVKGDKNDSDTDSQKDSSTQEEDAGDGSTNNKAKAKKKSSGSSNPFKDAESILISLDSSVKEYVFIWRYILELMPIKQEDYDYENRLASRLGERLLVMSGLDWNRGSRSRGRDWHKINSAITLETIFVNSYRQDLLKACPGACVLRDEMRDYFVSIAKAHHIPDPSRKGATKVVRKWDFPDQIPTPAEAREIGLEKTYDPEEMERNTNQVKPSQAAKDKGKQDPIQRAIDAVISNKLLWSSRSDVPQGTLESVMYPAVALMAKVRRRSEEESTFFLSFVRGPFIRPRRFHTGDAFQSRADQSREA